ncbi:hypothetical protein FRC12_007900 [Ceratobasidium sp. 428]|nr:hypothetical protein FRC12_007900 [Ceratobasidium sp. 428]
MCQPPTVRCWISQQYTDERLAGEYVWLWFAGFGNLLLYIPLFFILRGNIKWDEEEGWHSLRWKRLPPHSSRRSTEGLVGPNDTESTFSRKDDSGNPKPFLWYPFAYTIIVLPMSIVRWITFKDKGEPSPAASTATAVAVSVFNLSGLVNVVLILATRTNVLLFGSRGIIPAPNVPEERDHPQMEENDANVGMYAGGARRRWLRNSTTAPEPIGASPAHEVEAEDTGFGGPRVRLGREDYDEEDTSVGGSKFESSSRGRPSGGNMASPGLRSDPDSFAGVQVQSPVAATFATNQTNSGVYAPGRAYLESLGAQSARNSR